MAVVDQVQALEVKNHKLELQQEVDRRPMVVDQMSLMLSMQISLIQPEE
jgi:hypothetical protein